MRENLELPRLSLVERDRRWQAARQQMEARGLDCLVLWGWPAMWDFCTANARYLCPVGGNAEFNILVFPRHGDPTCFVLMPTFLDGWRASQDWVTDIRARRGSWADSVAQRIGELGLTAARIGMDGLAGPLDPDGWLPHSVYQRLRALLPKVDFVNLDDMLELMRTVKSEEELGILGRAAQLGDLMLATCRDTARPGVKELRGLRQHDGGHAGERRRGADPVSLGVRPLSVSAPVSLADDTADRAWRSDHLRNPSEIRRLFHPCRTHILRRRARAGAAPHL